MKSMPWTHTWTNEYRKNISKNELENFRLHRFLSSGRDGQRGLNKTSDFKDTRSFLITMNKKIDEIGRDFVFGLIDGADVGNCHNSVRLGDFINDYGELNAIAWYKSLKTFIGDGIKNACEIGGGFGAFAKVLIKDNEKI